MKFILFVTLVVLSFSSFAESMAYPMSPDPKLTPGALCDTPDRYRHPEQIPYCERNVNSFTKEIIFSNYRRILGYRLNSDRSNFKVDHFIPLCFGGSNNEENLWPQHISISAITDPIEAIGCEKLGQGKIKQKELIDLIVKVKHDLSKAPKAFKYLKSLR